MSFNDFQSFRTKSYSRQSAEHRQLVHNEPGRLQLKGNLFIFTLRQFSERFTISKGLSVVDLISWVWDAHIRLWNRWVRRVDGLWVVRNLLQVAVRSQDILLLAGDGWSDDGCAIVVGNSSGGDRGNSQETHELRKQIWNDVNTCVAADGMRRAQNENTGSVLWIPN